MPHPWHDQNLKHELLQSFKMSCNKQAFKDKAICKCITNQDDPRKILNELEQSYWITFEERVDMLMPLLQLLVVAENVEGAENKKLKQVKDNAPRLFSELMEAMKKREDDIGGVEVAERKKVATNALARKMKHDIAKAKENSAIIKGSTAESQGTTFESSANTPSVLQKVREQRSYAAVVAGLPKKNKDKDQTQDIRSIEPDTGPACASSKNKSLSAKDVAVVEAKLQKLLAQQSTASVRSLDNVMHEVSFTEDEVATSPAHSSASYNDDKTDWVIVSDSRVGESVAVTSKDTQQPTKTSSWWQAKLFR